MCFQVMAVSDLTMCVCAKSVVPSGNGKHIVNKSFCGADFDGEASWRSQQFGHLAQFVASNSVCVPLQ